MDSGALSTSSPTSAPTGWNPSDASASPRPPIASSLSTRSHLEEDQHLDAILLGPGHPLYAAVDERLNEKLAPLVGGIALYVDATAETPYRLHFFEISVRGQNTKGENQTLHGELVAVREELTPGAARKVFDGARRLPSGFARPSDAAGNHRTA